MLCSLTPVLTCLHLKKVILSLGLTIQAELMLCPNSLDVCPLDKVQLRARKKTTSPLIKRGSD
jgi:hypothetical protein